MVIFRHARQALLSCVLVIGSILALGTQTASAAGGSPVAIGVNIANSPDQAAPMQSYVAATGHAPTIVMWYQQWSEPLFYSSQLPHVSSIGALPMITWDPIWQGVGISLADVANGKYDGYIKASADAAAASRQPIYIRLAHEMNLSGSPFGPGQSGNTPASFIDAWRHVVTIFRQEHATNVEWVWSPNVDCSGKCPFSAFYPGDAWVDWVALDGYNYAAVDGVAWESLSQVFGSSYATLHRLTSKPMMIAETASTESGGNKAAWITQAFLQQIPIVFPLIHAVVWFDRNKETDWRVDSSGASLSAWNHVVASPLYAGSPRSLLALAPTAADVTTNRLPFTTPTILSSNGFKPPGATPPRAVSASSRPSTLDWTGLSALWASGRLRPDVATVAVRYYVDGAAPH